MSWALRRAVWSPSSVEIERTEMPRNFNRPSFICYDSKTNPVEHISHYIQLMSLYSRNDRLMCKVFPSSLSPMVMRWFNDLRKGSIHNFEELIQAFGAHFITCCWVPQPIDALLSMKMGNEKTFWSYANRYCELYNEIGGGNEQVIASKFRLGLPHESKLRDLLTMQPPKNMHQLIRRIEEHKRLEDDQQQSKGKALTNSQYSRDQLPRGFQQRPRREVRAPEPEVYTGGVNIAFKELVHKILERIKNEPYFWWPGKMGGDLSRRNQSLYCIYHWEKGHTTEHCRVFKDHLEQVIKAKHLKEFVVEQWGNTTR